MSFMIAEKNKTDRFTNDFRESKSEKGTSETIKIKDLLFASTGVIGEEFPVDQIKDAVSQAWVDGQSLRTYRHAPNAGSRKSWAAGDATSRAVRLAMITMSGEMGYPGVLSAPVWGFEDVSFHGEKLSLSLIHI